MKCVIWLVFLAGLSVFCVQASEEMNTERAGSFSGFKRSLGREGFDSGPSKRHCSFVAPAGAGAGFPAATVVPFQQPQSTAAVGGACPQMSCHEAVMRHCSPDPNGDHNMVESADNLAAMPAAQQVQHPTGYQPDQSKSAFFGAGSHNLVGSHIPGLEGVEQNFDFKIKFNCFLQLKI